MSSNEAREDIVQLAVAAYGVAPDAALVADLEAIIGAGGSLLDAAAALTAGERWEERYPASWTTGEFADEWLGSLLPGADAALMAAAREIVVGHLDAGGGFAELVLAAQQYLSGPDALAQVAAAARSFLDRSETAMTLSADQESAGPVAEPRAALALTAGGAETGRTAAVAQADGGAMEDYDGDGAADDSKTEAFDAAGRPVRVEYDFNSDGTANHVETYAHAGSITTQLIEADYGGDAGAIVGDGVFDSRERRTMLDGVTVRILIDADNDGAWDESAELFGFDGERIYTFGAGGWLESIGLDGDNDGTYEWTSAYTFTHHENGGIETVLIAFDGKTEGGPADGAVDEVWFEAYDVDGMREFIKFDDDGDGAYDRANFFTYTHHENGRIETKLTAHDGGSEHGPPDGVTDSKMLQTYDADGEKKSGRGDNDNDGTYEWFFTFTYHENGKIKTWLSESDLGVVGGTADDGVIDMRSLSTYDADGSMKSQWEDHDADGVYEWFYTYTYHENGERKTQLAEYDNGLGVGTAGDGVVDRRSLDTYDADGELVSSKEDNDGDGTYEVVSTYHEDGETKTKVTARDEGVYGRAVETYGADGLVESVKRDDDNDGTYETFAAYTYHENGWIKTWLIESDDGSGGGTAGDGVIDSRTLVKFDADGVEESRLEDNDGDGVYEEVRVRHEDGETETKVTARDVGPGHGSSGGVLDDRTAGTYDAGGLMESVKQDNDNDGTYESFVTYTYHESGRIETRLIERDDGSGGGTAGDGVVDSRTLVKFDADGVEESRWEDNDGDGAYERLYAYTYHESGRIETRLIERDDGSGGGTAGDGIIDGRWLDTYDADGELVSSKQDNDGDGTYEMVSTYHEDGELKTKVTARDGGPGHGSSDGVVDGRTIETYGADSLIESAKQDDDNDGTYESFAAYTYHENGRIETWLIESDDGSGGGTTADGVIDRRSLYTYDVDGELVSSKQDNDGDGAYELLVAYIRDENGEIKAKLAEFYDGSGGGVVVARRLFTYGADGVRGSSKYDGDGDGTYEAVSVVGDYDDDGAVDDSRTETVDAAGRPVRTEYDFDSDGTVNRIETNVRDGDITTRLIEIDYGKGGDAGGGVFDYRVQGTIADNVVIRFLFDADNDGTWDEPARPTVFDKPVVGDFSIWRTLAYTYGTDGWLESIKVDDNLDGVYDRIVTHAYGFHGDGRLKTWLSEEDDGAAGRMRDGAGVHREDGGLITGPIVYGYGPSGGLIPGKRRLLTYGADGVQESIKHDEAGGGAYDRISATTRTHHENGAVKTILTELDGGQGDGPADGVVDGRTIETCDADGMKESSVGDIDNDGTYDWAYTYTYHANGELKTKLTELDNGWRGGAADDGIADFRRLATYGADGALESSKWDQDGDGAYEDVRTYHENGQLKTKLVEFYDGSGGGTAVDGVVDGRSLDTYDADGELVSSKYDNDGDGTWDVVDTFGVVVDTFSRTGTVSTAMRAYTMGTDSTADDVTRAINFFHGTRGADAGTADSGADWYELGRGDDTITGGAGKDVFVFRHGDGTDVITDFEPRIDTILIRSNGFDPADVELESLALRAGEEAMHPHIPARLFPVDSSAVDVAVLTYGGGSDDRIIIVGGNGSEDFYRAHFLLHAGHEPDLSGLGG